MPPLSRRAKIWRLAPFLLALLSALPTAALELRAGHVRGLPPGQPATAAFFELHNSAAQPWVLVAASSDAAERVEIHRHQMNEGRMAMSQVAQVVVPAGGSFRFAPGEHHLMLIGLSRALREGDSVALTLEGADGSAITATLPVISVLNEARHHQENQRDQNNQHHQHHH